MDTPSQEPVEDQHSQFDEGMDEFNVRREALSFSAFTGLRATSNVLWIGGAAVSIYSQRKLGVEPMMAVPALAASVTGVEYLGTKVAKRVFEEPANEQQNTNNSKSRIIKELISFAYTAWSGAMSAVKVNQDLGLRQTNSRSIVQSALYGSAVSVWSAPVPGLVELQDTAVNMGEDVLNSPGRSALVAIVSSLAIYGVLETKKRIKSWRSSN